MVLHGDQIWLSSFWSIGHPTSFLRQVESPKDGPAVQFCSVRVPKFRTAAYM